MVIYCILNNYVRMLARFLFNSLLKYWGYEKNSNCSGYCISCF